jgi:hypothetical protein
MTEEPQVGLRPLRPMRFNGERRWALALELTGAGDEVAAFVARAEAEIALAERAGAALVYGFVEQRRADEVFGQLGFESLGAVRPLVRPLRLTSAAERLNVPTAARAFFPDVPLVLPFGGRRREGVREITTRDPRVTRLWDRFSIDVAIAIERNASFVGARVWDRPDADYRVLVFEDGDRYVIRALCVFRLKAGADGIHGHVLELLHDRSVAGMRAASHLLGLALREMSEAGAEGAIGWSLVHSGSFPMFARHGFVPAGSGNAGAPLALGVRALDSSLGHVVTERRHWYLSGLDFEEA